MTDHIQPNTLDSLIESRRLPAMLRTWAAKLRERGIDAMFSPDSYAVDFESMAGKIERDCNRLEYHLKTHIGKAVRSVVLHLDKDDDRCCAHCLVPMREHLSVDALCQANVELSKELADANERLRYAEALSKSLLEDAKIIDAKNA